MSKIESNLQNFKELPLADMIMADWNYKKNDDRLQKKLIANIKRSGQIENILVRPLEDGKYEVVNGNHRFLALQELGYENAVVYDLGDMSLKQAKRIAVETNETKFGADNIQLAELLNEISIEFDDLDETMPYTDKELENMQNLLDFDWDAQDDAPDNFSEDKEEIEEGGQKSETLISAGGDKFRTLKLEVAPDLADRFEDQLIRFKGIAGGAEKGFKLLLNLLEAVEDTDLDEVEVKPDTSKKRARKKRN